MSCVLFINAQVSKSIKLDTAGTLLTTLSSNELNTVTNLTLTGSIDARDFKTMRDQMPLLSELDLNEVTIVEYKGSEGTVSTLNTYPANVIPKYAFYKSGVENKNLTSISIPTSVTSIDEGAFLKCTGLDSVSFASPSSLETIGNGSFQICAALTSISIPASVTLIDKTAFAFCHNLDSVSFVSPSSLTTIGSFSFEGCALTSINIPASVNSIGNGAFMDCARLKSVSFSSPSSLTTIGFSAFISCRSLTSVDIPASVISIGKEAFQSCDALTSISIPASVTTIGDRAFYNSLAINSINVDADNSNYSSSDEALFNKDKTLLIYCPPAKAGNYTIPSTVTTVKNDAFDSCSDLTAITLPSNLTNIGELAFSRCSKITTFSLPATVSSIDQYAFFNCSDLTSLYVNRTNPVDLSSVLGVFVGVDVTNCTLYVPKGSKSEYASADQWKDFIHIVEMNPTSINQIRIDASYKIYPNPVTNILTIDLGDTYDSSALMTICNTRGALIMKQQLSQQKTLVDLSKLITGTYFIKVNLESKTQTKKLIKK